MENEVLHLFVYYYLIIKNINVVTAEGTAHARIVRLDDV